MAIRHNVRATGIPPYILLGQRILRVETLIEQMSDVIVNRTAVLLDEKGAAAGNVTNDQLKVLYNMFWNEQISVIAGPDCSANEA